MNNHRNLSLLLALAIIGIAAALFRPAHPHQVHPEIFEVPRGGFLFDPSPQNFEDEGLNNPEIQADESITAARKCGFCLG